MDLKRICTLSILEYRLVGRETQEKGKLVWIHLWMIEDSTYKTLAFYVYRIRSCTKSTQKLKASKLMYMCACSISVYFKPLPLSTITQPLTLLLGFSFFLNINAKVVWFCWFHFYTIWFACRVSFLFHVLLCDVGICVCIWGWRWWWGGWWHDKKIEKIA